MFKHECVILEAKVAFLECDRKRDELVHDFEMDHVKKQLQAKMVERKELLAQLEAHHRTVFQKRVERKAKGMCRQQAHSRHTL